MTLFVQPVIVCNGCECESPIFIKRRKKTTQTMTSIDIRRDLAAIGWTTKNRGMNGWQDFCPECTAKRGKV